MVALEPRLFFKSRPAARFALVRLHCYRVDEKGTSVFIEHVKKHIEQVFLYGRSLGQQGGWRGCPLYLPLMDKHT